MNNHECPNCGYVLGERDKKCKYCGTANPDYVEPKTSVFGSPFASSQQPQTSSSQSSSTPATSQPRFRVGIFILLIFLFWPGAIIYAIISSIKR